MASENKENYRGCPMNQNAFEEKMNEILNCTDIISGSDKEKILHLARKNQESHKLLQDKLSQLQNSLDCLRLGIKYLMFDLEATRRENTTMRKQLMERHNPDDRPQDF